MRFASGTRRWLPVTNFIFARLTQKKSREGELPGVNKRDRRAYLATLCVWRRRASQHVDSPVRPQSIARQPEKLPSLSVTILRLWPVGFCATPQPILTVTADNESSVTIRSEAPVGFEPTMADLQSAALATWLRRLIVKSYCNSDD